MSAAIYIPRHAGHTAQAAARSAARRDRIDTQRALALLDAQADRGNLTALRLALKLRASRFRDLVAS